VKRKIAPVLGALLHDLRAQVKPGKAGAGDAQVLRLARAELRVLLAVARLARRFVRVARLARRFVREDDCAPGELRWGHHVGPNDEDLGMDQYDFAVKMDRALARLDRLPGAAPREGR
jgi:hypothetical protein